MRTEAALKTKSVFVVDRWFGKPDVIEEEFDKFAELVDKEVEQIGSASVYLGRESQFDGPAENADSLFNNLRGLVDN